MSSGVGWQASVDFGRTADDFAVFSGANLLLGSLLPTNPNGGGSGVIIEGFDTNDTNNLFFTDNGGTSQNFPFVAAGNIVVNQGLVDDTDGEAWLYYAYTRDGISVDATLITEGLGVASRLDGQHRDYLVSLETEARAGSVGCLWRSTGLDYGRIALPTRQRSS